MRLPTVLEDWLGGVQVSLSPYVDPNSQSFVSVGLKSMLRIVAGSNVGANGFIRY